jgi:hydrogenase maturation protease
MTGRTLIACLGNIFLSDDGFGVEVAKRFAGQELPEGVRVTDYGIRGMHLAYDLAEGFDTTILVDAMQRGDEPGTVYVVEPQPAQHPAAGHAPGGGDGEAGGGGTGGDGLAGGSPLAAMSLFNAHGMQPEVVLDMAGMLGAEAGRVLVVGCEPASLEEGIGLSPPVAAAVDEAVRVVTRLVASGAPGDGIQPHNPQPHDPQPHDPQPHDPPPHNPQRSAAAPQRESRERARASRSKTTKR